MSEESDEAKADAPELDPSEVAYLQQRLLSEQRFMLGAVTESVRYLL